MYSWLRVHKNLVARVSLLAKFYFLRGVFLQIVFGVLFSFFFFSFFYDARQARWGPPDGWEPPGARSRKVGSLKKNGNAETENLLWCVSVEKNPLFHPCVSQSRWRLVF